MNPEQTLEQKIEAVLFYKNEPVETKKLASLLGKSENEVKEGLRSLGQALEGRGVCLIVTDKEASLATAPGMTELIEQITKDDLSREIGKAGLETLSIILYNSEGIGRRRIDYIRGVNSTFILRNLVSRGLVERQTDPKDQRSFVYKPTLQLLAHIGVKNISDIPDFGKFKVEMVAEEPAPE